VCVCVCVIRVVLVDVCTRTHTHSPSKTHKGRRWKQLAEVPGDQNVHETPERNQEKVPLIARVRRSGRPALLVPSVQEHEEETVSRVDELTSFLRHATPLTLHLRAAPPPPMRHGRRRRKLKDTSGYIYIYIYIYIFLFLFNSALWTPFF